MATIDAYYFRVCTRGAQRAGIDVSALLAAAGIDPAAPERPGWRGPVEAMARLVRAIWDELDDEAMGFTRHGLKRGAFAFAAELAFDGATVAAGLSRAIAFYNLASRDIRTELALDGKAARLDMRLAEPGLDPDNYFSEFWLIIWHRLASWLAGETVPLLEASFDYGEPRAYFEEFRHLFPCPHRFDTSARAIVMDARPLAGPIRRSAAELAAMLGAAPLDIMTIPASDGSLARRVRSLLRRDHAMPGEALAARLGINGEALRRSLRREGSSLSAERENVRRDTAVRALLQSNRSVEAIADDLGYAEARSFTRAFRAWTGTSPSRFRRQ